MFNILFTCVGRRVELVQAFLKSATDTNVPLVLWGTDVSDTAPALFCCHKRMQVCAVKDENYISQLVSICAKNKIDLVIPTIDTDLLTLAKNRILFEDVGTKVLVSSEDVIRACRDKRLTAELFAQCGLKTPTAFDDINCYSGEYPCFIKPLDGSSSIDAHFITNENELKNRAATMTNYIIQPFIKGTEYTVDILCDFTGKAKYITPRERVATRSGEVSKTRIVNDEQIVAECMKLIDFAKLQGAITVQLIREKTTGQDYYIEINPRFGGGAPLSMKAGADSAGAILDMLMNRPTTYLPNAAANGALYCRFDQCLRVQSVSDMDVQAVIFDLDDTLYAEKDYVKSGFRAIEQELGAIENAFLKLWEAFSNGESAIDFVLNSEGMYSDRLKERCLAIYRNHKPNLLLTDDVENLLMEFKNRGIKTGIITDGEPARQRAKIFSLGLEKLVDEIIVTDELGGKQFRKPCDIAFRVMQLKLGVSYENMVYVGDNVCKDFIAPQSLSMGCVCIANPTGLYFSDNAEHKIGLTVVTSIGELRGLLL